MLILIVQMIIKMVKNVLYSRVVVSCFNLSM